MKTKQKCKQSKNKKKAKNRILSTILNVFQKKKLNDLDRNYNPNMD